MGRAAEANRAAMAAGEEVGPGAANTVAMGCDLVRIGVFFDGTLNSRRHISRDNIAWYTNVDLMERQYDDIVGGPQMREVSGVQRQVNYGSLYMRGIGVNVGGSTDLNGSGRGMGPEGVRDRVEDSIEQLRIMIYGKARGMEVCDLWFDVFGFSRGAAAARHFANQVRASRITTQEAVSRVKFMGLYDTVVMIGTGRATNGADDQVDVSTFGVADKIVHIRAKDEIRYNFPLTNAVGATNYTLVGAHSDIGGGYSPRLERDSFAWEQEDYPGLTTYLDEKWNITSSSPGADTSSPDVLTTTTENSILQPHDYGEESHVFSWSAQHGLQFVSLRLMYDEALAAGVPLKPWSNTINGVNVGISGMLKDYYDAIKANRRNVSAGLERQVRLRYCHVSFNASYSGPFQAHLPEERARRHVAVE